MKKITSIILLTAISIATFVGSCTGNFDEYNRDDFALTEELKKADWIHLKAFISQMQQSIYYNNSGGDWEFQLIQNLNADIFSGYLTPPTPFNGDVYNANYYMMENWNHYAFDYYNNNILKPWLNVKAKTLDLNESLDVYGVALILKVAGLHRSTDLYGPIPYSKYGQGGITTPYDSQEDIYNQFFKELDEAVGYLTNHLEKNKDINSLGNADLIYKGNYEKWLKWANSLRLRLAIRISKVNPSLAKTEAEKAMSNKYGVLETNSDNVMVPTTNIGHPLIVLANDYNDTRMSADMESILTGLKDPRISEYFSVATDENVNVKGKYKGVRQGINFVSKDLRSGYSTLGDRFNISNYYSTPITLMTAAEVYFLRAEGVLRGWNNMGETAENLYNKGIEISMQQWGLPVTKAYITDDVNKPADYVDPKNANYNVSAASKVTVKWDNSADPETNLEKIITQKWIAMFPEGKEAWAEFRRTGYPKLLPIEVNNSGGEIDSKVMIRRLRFPQNERTGNNRDEVTKAIQLLKGADSPGTRLWWDTGGSNF
ncbi:SusD/RagB family nutrient-binding outer membrane lipoprotein [Capnocytophaga cynodegmi]|uniref:SusD/RagB family nutrient-binding outer membrane lipoprotein n=1 Tax=Capnocytophaga cynodegmi TaxID=28189 RepID=A0A286NT66_9FLAO|nr:RagB/SusD family nutrient uptake outer membrane protein [Capnocytophaga cynodegmi]ATA67149.1 SusD/RagB family nutrient-binding outer membrane lipoprotein [Capnocytophaga cynodegmi]